MGNSLFVRSDELCLWSVREPGVCTAWRHVSFSSVLDLTAFSVEFEELCSESFRGLLLTGILEMRKGIDGGPLALFLCKDR